MKVIYRVVCVCLMTSLLCVPCANAKNYLPTEVYYENRTAYRSMVMLADNIQVNPETGEVTFQNGGMLLYQPLRPDTNTYVINADTDICYYDGKDHPEDAYFEEFKAGEHRYVTFFIRAQDYWEMRPEINNQTIPVLCFFDASASVSGLSDEKGYPQPFTDIAPGEPLYLETYRLVEMNVYDNGFRRQAFLADEPVTRAEMAQFLVRLHGLDAAAVGHLEAESFSDVPQSHPAAAAVYLAQEFGLLEGNGDGTFAPDAGITAAQAIKMLVDLLGYTPRAQQTGGYPNGYWTVAQGIGLLGEMDIYPEKVMTRGEIASLMNTVLDTPLMIQIGFGSQPEYVVRDGINGEKLTLYDAYLR